jgi:[acyl-carrier-protein] S-malonyltransferase
VGGAFHSPLMQPAQDQLKEAIEKTAFGIPKCPIYQNISAAPETDPERIQVNLIKQLTGPVRWTQTMQRMLADGVTEFIEVGGTGKVLQGLVKKIDRRFPTSKLEVL